MAVRAARRERRAGARRGGRARARVRVRDWSRVAQELAERGHARLAGLLTPPECAALARLWDEPARFRTHVDLGRHRFGQGAYRYFDRPLPPLVEELRRQLYPPLARIADAWAAALGAQQRLPASLDGFLARCRAAGQTRPTPLLLRYEAGGYNRLHQDLYGEVAFPLQVTVLLSDPQRDFAGGEFLLLEQRPRMQSRGEAVALRQGEAIVFPTRERPLEGARGITRATLRHGVSRIHAGLRLTLGIIFHDSR
jgi:hypothetical protein